MRIAILVEGRTERVFQPFLRSFLSVHLQGQMPKLDFVPQDGGIPTNDKLLRVVEYLLNDRKSPADAVIALTDVYTGKNPPVFLDANDAKQKLHQWVRGNPNFYPHVALYDFEAWLLPYWSKIQRLARTNRTPPSTNPEAVNHGNPPAYRLQEVFRTGGHKKSYSKTIDAPRILNGEDLLVSINACSELKSFVNRIIELCGGTRLL
ncbi:MAG: DUF4276 family protein [Planctomycetes bacterium]|nr:DUF4276 family protein [Planctomycetota bacterium]